MFDLTDRKALVTGASGGIGEHIARALHGQGAKIALSGTRTERLEQLAKDLGERTVTATVNLSDREAVDNLIPEVEEKLEGLDILVNNAGITRDNVFMRMKDEDWDAVLEVNLTAAFRLARSAVKGMMKQRFGRIIGITSVVGVAGNPGQGNYAASKAGMIGLTKSLAQEVASRNITVNTIAPGMIESPMTDSLNEKQRETIIASIPSGRLGRGDEVASAVVFLASDEGAYITGQTINVNGGMYMV